MKTIYKNAQIQYIVVGMSYKLKYYTPIIAKISTILNVNQQLSLQVFYVCWNNSEQLDWKISIMTMEYVQ